MHRGAQILTIQFTQSLFVSFCSWLNPTLLGLTSLNSSSKIRYPCIANSKLLKRYTLSRLAKYTCHSPALSQFFEFSSDTKKPPSLTGLAASPKAGYCLRTTLSYISASTFGTDGWEPFLTKIAPRGASTFIGKYLRMILIADLTFRAKLLTSPYS